jgi:hypothetical protein
MTASLTDTYVKNACTPSTTENTEQMSEEYKCGFCAQITSYGHT